MKEYLGDSVYAEIEHEMVKLTTENGYGPTNTIYLELEVYAAFVTYMARQGHRVVIEGPEHAP